MSFEVIPAIDLLDGKCVRLVKGKPGTKTVYCKDAARLARGFTASGAKTIHVIDLNAALGNGDNSAAIKAVVKAIHGKARLQVGGGVRSVAKAKELFSSGVDRVIVGSMAFAFAPVLEEITRLGETLAAIDYANDGIRVKGWTRRGVKLSERILSELEERGVRGFIATDIERDGTLKGARTRTLREIVKATALPVCAAGGVASLGDLKKIAASGAAGAVVGKALYEKRFTLAEAIEVARKC